MPRQVEAQRASSPRPVTIMGLHHDTIMKVKQLQKASKSSTLPTFCGSFFGDAAFGLLCVGTGVRLRGTRRSSPPFGNLGWWHNSQRHHGRWADRSAATPGAQTEVSLQRSYLASTVTTKSCYHWRIQSHSLERTSHLQFCEVWQIPFSAEPPMQEMAFLCGLVRRALWRHCEPNAPKDGCFRGASCVWHGQMPTQSGNTTLQAAY